MSMRVNSVLCAVALLVIAAVPPSIGQELAGFPTNPGRAAVNGPGAPNNLSLVISQTQEVHEQVANLLEQLRRLQGMQTVIEVPFTTVQDDYFERIGVNFGFSLPGGRNVVGLDPIGNPTPNGNIEFRQGSFGAALPPFGGFDPNTQATTGFRIQRGGAAFDFGFAAAQGSNRSIVTQAPVVQMMDGVPATVSDVSQQPFVTSVIPVVGGFHGDLASHWPMVQPTINPLQQAIQRYYRERSKGVRSAVAPELTPKPTAAVSQILSDPNVAQEDKVALKLAASRGSSAGHGDLSVAEIRRRKAARDAAEQQALDQEILVLIERGRGAEEAGKIGVAKIYYQQAATRASGQLKQQLLAKLEELETK